MAEDVEHERSGPGGAPQLPAAAGGRLVTVSLDMKTHAVLRLLNTVLTVATAGIYWPWARTRMRKLVWSSIKLDGDSLEYTGQVSELIAGFVIALALFMCAGSAVPLLLLWLIAPSSATAAAVLLCGSIGLFYVSFAPFEQFYARRYLLTRTRWRGIGASQDAKLTDWMKRHIGWSLLNVLTLGLAVPWTSAARYNYRAQHTRFGAEPVTASAKGKALLAAWLKFWLACTLTIALLAIMTDSTAAANMGGEALTIVFGAVLCVVVYLWMRFSQESLRYFGESTKLGGRGIVGWWPNNKTDSVALWGCVRGVW
jgi:uncharacterized membrane protein YjgN (DUF898 family)